MEITYSKGEKKNVVNVNITISLHYPADFNTGDDNKPAVKLDILKRLRTYISNETKQAELNYEEHKIRNSKQGDLFQ